jgi:hypothetical protein
MFDESVELVSGGLAARVEIEHELGVERGVWVDGRGEDVVREGCDERRERGELFCWGEGERRARRGHGLEHLAEWCGGLPCGLVWGVVIVRAVVVLHVSEEGPGAVEGRVGNEEEIAREGEKGDEGDEGRAEFFALLPGGREGVEEGHGERHRWKVGWGVGRF